MKHARPIPITPENRREISLDFWRRVDDSDILGCWNWTRSTESRGYGQYRFHNGQSVMAHRVAYALFHRTTISPMLLVLHQCDNKLCCNPHHLILGTNRRNISDAHQRGLVVTKRHLTPADARRAWFLRLRTSLGHTLIARQLGLPKTAVMTLFSGLSYRSLHEVLHSRHRMLRNDPELRQMIYA